MIEETIRRIIREELRAALADAKAHKAAANEDEELLDMHTAAEVAGLSHSTLREWARSERLRTTGERHSRRTTRAWIREALAVKRTPPPASPEAAARALLARGAT